MTRYRSWLERRGGGGGEGGEGVPEDVVLFVLVYEGCLELRRTTPQVCFCVCIGWQYLHANIC